MSGLESVIAILTPEEVKQVDWDSMSQDARISLEFVDRTISKYPWRLLSLISRKDLNPRDVIDFVIKHADRFTACDEDNFLMSILTLIPIPELKRLDGIVIDWKMICSQPVLGRLCLNPSIDLQFIEEHQMSFSSEDWHSICTVYEDPVQLYDTYPNINIRWIGENPNIPVSFIKTHLYPANKIPHINCINLPIEFVRELALTHTLINVAQHPEISLDILKMQISVIGFVTSVYSNPSIRMLDILLMRSNGFGTATDISQNPNITPELICLAPELHWPGYGIARHISIDSIELAPEVFSIQTILYNPEFSVEHFLKYRDGFFYRKPWFFVNPGRFQGQGN